MLAQTQIPWEEAAKVWGPLGVIFILAVALVYGLVKWFKVTMDATLADARSERNAMRQLNADQATQFRQQNESQANRFLEALERRDRMMEESFDEVLHEIRSGPPTRRR